MVSIVITVSVFFFHELDGKYFLFYLILVTENRESGKVCVTELDL